jgi:hypothetical protein
MDYSNKPFNGEDFGISRAREVSLERLCGRLAGIVSPSDVDESDPNKFNTRFGARVTSLPHMEVQNVFLPATSEPAEEVLMTNFSLCFKALARASS